MRVQKAFAPLTITLDTKEDLSLFKIILNMAYRESEPRWCSMSSTDNAELKAIQYLLKQIGE